MITYTPLSNQLSQLGANAILSTLHSLASFKQRSTPQDESLVSKAPKVHKELGSIQWNRHTARDIWIMYRALGDTLGIYSWYKHINNRVRLVTIKPPGTTLSYANAGTILYYTILYYTILYYTILYYTIIYYTIHIHIQIQIHILSSDIDY